MTDDPFRCTCPAIRNPTDPPDLIFGRPRAAKDCPAHRARYIAQQYEIERLAREPTP